MKRRSDGGGLRLGLQQRRELNTGKVAARRCKRWARRDVLRLYSGRGATRMRFGLAHTRCSGWTRVRLGLDSNSTRGRRRRSADQWVPRDSETRREEGALLGCCCPDLISWAQRREMGRWRARRKEKELGCCDCCWKGQAGRNGRKKKRKKKKAFLFIWTVFKCNFKLNLNSNLISVQNPVNAK